MAEADKPRTIVRSQQLNLNLENIFHSIIMLDFNYPVCNHTQAFTSSKNQIETENQHSFIKSLGNVQNLINSLKFLKLKEKKVKKKNQVDDKFKADVSSFLFCRPLKHNNKDEKVFWILKNKLKQKLNLDNPKGVLILPNHYLIAIERKYINLYQVEESLSVSLKDFDSNGLGKKFTFTDLKHVTYRGNQYVLIFGNQKHHFKQIFLALVFEVSKGRLKFVKKAQLAEKQIVSPTVIFENDPSSKDEEKYCLVLGGCCDNYETFHYSALKINLHILLSQFLSYDLSSSITIPFNNKRTALLSGKAISYKEAWYCFCSEEQTINEIVLQYGGPGKALTMIDIKSETLNLKEKIYFSQDSMHYIYEGEEDKIVFVDKNLELKQRSLNDMIYKLRG